MCACLCVYVCEATDDVADFSVFENKIEGSKQVSISYPSLYIEGKLCRSNGKKNIFKETVLKKWDT